jgi:hypothetical protein
MVPPYFTVRRPASFRAVAMLCVLALFLTPICGLKCSQPACGSRASAAAQEGDCHGAVAQGDDDTVLANIQAFHHCATNEQPPAALAETKPDASQFTPRPNSISISGLVAKSPALLVEVNAPAVFDSRSETSNLPSHLSVLRI